MNYASSLTTNSRSRDLKPPLLVDGVLLIVTLLLVCLSIIMVYSTTGVVSQEKFGDSLFYVKRQVIAVFIGFVFLYLGSRASLEIIRKLSPLMFPMAVGLLLLTLIPGIGDASGGAQRWINLGLFRFQPGELVKLMFIVFIAGYFARQESSLHLFTSGLVKPFAYVGVVCLLLLLQPDFGSSVILAVVVMGMAAAAGAKIKHLLLCMSGCLLAAAALVITSPYRMGRVLSFLSPMQDSSGKGYQLIQSLIAVGNGQVNGVGLGASQQKLFFLPAAHTDFIYAVIAEELGFIGCLAVIAVFMVFLWRGLWLAGRFVDDTFSFCLAVGLTLLIVAPALVNIGVVLGLLPTKGLVLPLIAYGGSSMVVSLAAVGLLFSLARTFRCEKNLEGFTKRHV